jgi:Helix-turn-helix domain
MERMFEYRLRPGRAQQAALLKVLAASRRLYNDALAEWKAYFEATGKYLHIYDQDKRYNKTTYPERRLRTSARTHCTRSAGGTSISTKPS